MATGTELEIVGGDKPYADMRFDHEISEIYKRNVEALGREFPPLSPMMARLAASTDMGNVSQVIPSIHPMIGINSLPAANHQPEFTAHCITETADKAVLDGALDGLDRHRSGADASAPREAYSPRTMKLRQREEQQFKKYIPERSL